MHRPALRQDDLLDTLLMRQHAGVSDFETWMASTKAIWSEPTTDGPTLRPTFNQLVSLFTEDRALYRDVMQAVRAKIGDREHKALIKQASPKLPRQRGTVDDNFYTIAHGRLRLLITAKFPPKENGSWLHTGQRLGGSLCQVVSALATWLDAGEIWARNSRTSLFLKLCNQARNEVAQMYPGPNAPRPVLENYERLAIRRLLGFEDLARRRFGITNPEELRDLID